MLLDIRTLLFVMATSNALIFVLVGSSFVSRRRDTRGMVCWLWSYAAQSVGWSLLLLRGIAPDWLTVVVGNTLLIAGLALIFRAICDFLERTSPWSTTILPTASFASVLTGLYAFRSPSTAILVWISLTASAFAIACAWVLMRGIKWRSAPARWTTGLWLGIGGAVMLIRAITALLSPAATYNIYTQSVLQVIAFVVAYSAMLGGSFGFNLMVQERTTHVLQQIARMDELTGIFNRRYLLDRVRLELNRMARRRSKSMILMMLDIDNFKEVNDRHGHAAGDELLKSVALQLTNILRGPDILGRYGGEEFCVLLPDTDKNTGLQVAERLRAAANSAQITVGNETLKRTISIGVADACLDTLPGLDELFLSADRALYRAKEEGRNRVVYAEKLTTLTTTSPISSNLVNY